MQTVLSPLLGIWGRFIPPATTARRNGGRQSGPATGMGG